MTQKIAFTLFPLLFSSLEASSRGVKNFQTDTRQLIVQLWVEKLYWGRTQSDPKKSGVEDLSHCHAPYIWGFFSRELMNINE
jgi:hypothetical protein